MGREIARDGFCKRGFRKKQTMVDWQRGKASMAQTDMVKERCRGFGEEKQTAFEKRARAVSADREEMMEGAQVF